MNVKAAKITGCILATVVLFSVAVILFPEVMLILCGFALLMCGVFTLYKVVEFEVKYKDKF